VQKKTELSRNHATLHRANIRDHEVLALKKAALDRRADLEVSAGIGLAPH
jgi:hypothetical protein